MRGGGKKKATDHKAAIRNRSSLYPLVSSDFPPFFRKRISYYSSSLTMPAFPSLPFAFSSFFSSTINSSKTTEVVFFVR